MKWQAAIVMVLASTAVARGQQPTSDMRGMAHMSHMAMPKTPNARLTLANDDVQHVLTVRLGPLSLPAHAGMNVAQAPDLHWTVPFDGWFTGYRPAVVDDSGNALPGRLLHHVAVYDTSRANFLCPKQPEHIFGAGGEMTEWPALPGLGYQIHKGDRILVATMFHNDEATSYPRTYLQIAISYQPLNAGGPALMSVYPAWFDVKECGESGYDLNPGRNVTTGDFKLAFSGRLIGVGGHMHDYGQELTLEDTTRGQKIADLEAKLDEKGRLISIPIARFTESGGLPLPQGDVIRVTAIYNNTTGRYLPQGAMGIAVGYFLPDNAQDFGALRAPLKSGAGFHGP